MPVEIVFMPHWFFFNIYEASSWSRAMLMPLAILNHHKPTRHLPSSQQLHELYPVGAEQENLGLVWDGPRISWPNFFLVCDAMLKLLHKLPWKPWRKHALARAEAWMTERMGEGSDGLGAIFPAMLNSMIAVDLNDPVRSAGIAFLKSSVPDGTIDGCWQLLSRVRDQSRAFLSSLMGRTCVFASFPSPESFRGWATFTESLPPSPSGLRRTGRDKSSP